ncbi:MAG: Sec-independent protein translocase subunit TatA/TatB [Thermoleophilaceae bacterium]
MPTPGIAEIAIVLVIVLVIFGPKRLPDLGRSLGSGMREFKDSVTGGKKDDDELSAGEKAEPVHAEKKPEPVRAEKSEATPAGGQSS